MKTDASTSVFSYPIDRLATPLTPYYHYAFKVILQIKLLTKFSEFLNKNTFKLKAITRLKCQIDSALIMNGEIEIGLVAQNK